MLSRILIAFGGFLISSSFAMPASAQQVSCDPVWVQHYRFAPQHEYVIHKTCRGYRSAFSMVYRAAWDGARATERITYTYNRFLETGQLYQTNSGEVRTAANCPNDPWLGAGNCSGFTFEGDGVPSGELRAAIGEMPYPISARLLSGAQRAELQNSFAQMNTIAGLPVEIVSPEPWQVIQIDLPADAGTQILDGLTQRVTMIGRVQWPGIAGSTQGYAIEFELTRPKGGALVAGPLAPQGGDLKTFVIQLTPQGSVNVPVDLSPGQYGLRARLKGEHTGGMVEGPWSAQAFFLVSPVYPPANLKAEPWGVSLCTKRPVRLTWEYLIAGVRFTIERAHDQGGFQPIGEFDFHDPSFIDSYDEARRLIRYGFVDHADKPGGIYRYRIRATVGRFRAETSSNEASVTFWPVAAPAAPTGLRKGSVQIRGTPLLSWQDNSSNESGFVIERQDPGRDAFQKVGQTEANRHAFTDTSAKGVTGNYAYRVKALMEDGCPSEYSNTLFVRVETGSGSAPGSPALGGSDDAGRQGSEDIRTDLGLTPMENRAAFAVNMPIAFQLHGPAATNARFEFERLQGGRWMHSSAPRTVPAPRDSSTASGGHTVAFSVPLTGQWRVRPLDAKGTPGPWQTFDVAAGVAPQKKSPSKAADAIVPVKKPTDAAKAPALKPQIGLHVPRIEAPRKNDRLWAPATVDVKLVGGMAGPVQFDVEKQDAGGRFRPFGTYATRRITLIAPGQYRIRVKGSEDWTPFRVEAQPKAVQPAVKGAIEKAPTVTKPPAGVKKLAPASQ